MKRRTFCGAALGLMTPAVLPFQRSLATSSREVIAKKLNGLDLTLSAADLADLRAGLHGELLTPDEEAYDTARRVWNGAFERKPALIIRCREVADVVQAVTFGAAHELLTAVRGGGHSLSGQSTCDGGLVIDLSPMSGIWVDPLSKTARVEPGILLGQFDREAQESGLATTSGTVSHTGVAGLTLGGGFGRLARRYGLACDNLIAADVVTAAGRVTHASVLDNSELLWGLRGGGGNFGVVTSFEFKLHPLASEIYGGQLTYPLASAREVLKTLDNYLADAGDELYVELSLVPGQAPKGTVRLEVCDCGPPAQAVARVAPLRHIGKPIDDQLTTARYLDLQRRNDGSNPHGRSYYVKSGYLGALTPNAIDALVDCLPSAPPEAGQIGLVSLGGAIARVEPAATAYWHRQPNYALVVAASWADTRDAEASTNWLRDVWTRLETFTTGFYVNLSGREDSMHRAMAAYGGNYSRLAALKQRFDPQNFFRLNANVLPTGSSQLAK